MGAISPFVHPGARKQGPWDWEYIMFPEIMRDDVFRLETRRLWLRWPNAADADVTADLMGQCPDGRVVHVCVGAVGATVARWRAQNAGGAGLHLLMTAKADRTVVGALHLVGDEQAETADLTYALLPAWRGKGLMREAVQAGLDAVFMVSRLGEVTVSVGVANPDARTLVERCGFTYAGTGLGRRPQAPGLAACDRFVLGRKTWASLQGWRQPDFGPGVADRAFNAY